MEILPSQDRPNVYEDISVREPTVRLRPSDGLISAGQSPTEDGEQEIEKDALV